MKTGKHSRYANAKQKNPGRLNKCSSVRFLAQLKNISREDMEKFVEKAVCLHPHLQSLLLPDEAILSSPPAHADVPPWCQCGHCRARRSSSAVANGQDCILQTAEVEMHDVLRRNVLLVAIRHMNVLFAYNEQPSNYNFRQQLTDN